MSVVFLIKATLLKTNNVEYITHYRVDYICFMSKKQAKRLDSNFLENKENKIYLKLLDMLRDTTIAASQIIGIELTEIQLEFIFSSSFRKIILKEQIKIITELLYGDEKEICEKNKIEINGIEKIETENKNKKKRIR